MPIFEGRTDKRIEGLLTRGKRGAMYRTLCTRLDPDALTAIRQHLASRIVGDIVFTRQWIPSRWSETVFARLCDQAAEGDSELAARMLRLLIWETFEQHGGDWVTLGCDESEEDYKGGNYFRINKK